MFGTILTVCLALNVESFSFETAEAPTKIGSASGKLDTCANGACRSNSVVRSKSVVRSHTSNCGSSCVSKSKKRTCSSCRSGRFFRR